MWAQGLRLLCHKGRQTRHFSEGLRWPAAPTHQSLSAELRVGNLREKVALKTCIHEFSLRGANYLLECHVTALRTGRAPHHTVASHAQGRSNVKPTARNLHIGAKPKWLVHGRCCLRSWRRNGNNRGTRCNWNWVEKLCPWLIQRLCDWRWTPLQRHRHGCCHHCLQCLRHARRGYIWRCRRREPGRQRASWRRRDRDKV
mmetsp:Transcript_7998/g.22059  ORF Transcript_7998/g.22059 Transcript_7998/m.22059 type:complete len:200 (-) Transcript_7998:463-1062(-)